MNQIFLTLFKSVIITFSVAAAFSYFLTTFGINFFQSFIALIAIQFIFFYFYGEYFKRKNSKLQLDAEIKLAEEIAKQSTTVTCPCDRKIQTTIPIKVDGLNEYKCPGCEKNISVHVSTKTYLATTPLLNNPIDAPLFADVIEAIIEKNGNKPNT